MGMAASTCLPCRCRDLSSLRRTHALGRGGYRAGCHRKTSCQASPRTRAWARASTGGVRAAPAAVQLTQTTFGRRWGSWRASLGPRSVRLRAYRPGSLQMGDPWPPGRVRSNSNVRAGFARRCPAWRPATALPPPFGKRAVHLSLALQGSASSGLSFLENIQHI
jgi:hypothetical protein